MTTQRIIVGITGASGAAYAQRTIGAMVEAGIEVHLIVSPFGQRLLHDELGMEGVNIDTLAGGKAADRVVLHNYRDVGAAVASGSFKTDGMLIVPCSSNSLAAVATGNQNNLLHRAAHVTLKERRRLVLVHREMPLSLVDIRNMQSATEAGAIICPANPGFYHLPQSLDDIVDFVAARLLDLFDIDHDLSHRWGEPKQTNQP